MNLLILIGSLPRDEPVITFGKAVAEETSSSITLLHVVPSVETEGAAEMTLSAIAQILSEINTKIRVRKGDLIKEAMAEMKSDRYNLLIIGAPHGRWLGDYPMSRVTRSIVNQSKISVLVVRQPQRILKRILVCTGGSDISIPVIKAGAELASVAKASVTLLHVVSSVPSMYTGLWEIEESLSELLQTDTPTAQHLREGARILSAHRVMANLELRYGIVVDEILEKAVKGHYDLIIAGATGKSKKLKNIIMGDIVGELIDRAQCPLLLVKNSLGINSN